MKRTALLKRKTSLKRGSMLKTGTSLKRKPMRRKPVTESKMSILDRIFSEYIRRVNADSQLNATCFTCGKSGHFKTMQLGHFRPRAHLATRYNEINCKVQCEDCNCFNGGMYDTFAIGIDRIHGSGTAERMEILSDTIIHSFPFDEKIAEYSQKLIALIKQQDTVINY